MPKGRPLVRLGDPWQHTPLNSESEAAMTVQVTELSTFLSQQDARRRIESAYETTVAVKELPSLHVAWEATATAVLVTATDMNVLAEWLFVMKGWITKVDLPSGQTAWTLVTRTWSDSDKVPVVPVCVTVVQPTDAPVMHEIAAAVTR